MRLLVITNLFHPDRGGGASVFSDLCFGLAERGWSVTVFTTHPYYPEWRRKSDAPVWRRQRERLRGVDVVRHGLHVPAQPSKLIPRVLFEASFLASLARSLFAGPRFDAVMVYCPTLSSVAFAALRRWVWREPVWLNVQDIPADAASASGISRSRLFDRVAQWGQRWLFNQAQVWSTISPIMARRLAELRRRNQPLHVIPNWLNESMAAAVEASSARVRRLPGAPFRLLYAGNIGKKQGLLDTLQALQRSSAAIQVDVHGDGGEAAGVRAWIESVGDARFRFGPFLDEAGFVAALHRADAFLISERPGSGASFIPSKLIPGIATGTPIVAVCDGDGPLGVEMRDHRLGLVTDWSGLEGLADRVVELGRDGTGFIELQRQCLERAKAYHRRYALDGIAAKLGEVIAGVRA
ncbi:MAG: glycosyltransferase family 4 protein [Verrucomicrobiales bacterium]|nr:glycosyltransferase family 4 protein [Verrucomicrobiales bacterium]